MVLVILTCRQSWISDFVSLSGGGLIVLDSKRDRDSSSNELPLSKLLPITVVAQSIENSIYSVKLTQSAMNQAAFQLGANESSNESIWSQLPAPKSVRTVGLSPGAETMIELGV